MSLFTILKNVDIAKLEDALSGLEQEEMLGVLRSIFDSNFKEISEVVKRKNVRSIVAKWLKQCFTEQFSVFIGAVSTRAIEFSQDLDTSLSFLTSKLFSLFHSEEFLTEHDIISKFIEQIYNHEEFSQFEQYFEGYLKYCLKSPNFGNFLVNFCLQSQGKPKS